MTGKCCNWHAGSSDGGRIGVESERAGESNSGISGGESEIVHPTGESDGWISAEGPL